MIDNLIVDEAIKNFVEFVEKTSGEKFIGFATSSYLNDQENYKYEIHQKAKNALGSKNWTIEDVGTGRIIAKTSAALEVTVYLNNKTEPNNLVYWEAKKNFKKKVNNEQLEAILFNFYKSKISDKVAFEQLMREGLTYQLIAFLFFIKDEHARNKEGQKKYLPISQERFDEIFKQLGITDFETSGNASWENYSKFCEIFKQVRKLLESIDKNATLLDAHSFLWVFGSQMQNVIAVKALEDSNSPSEFHINSESPSSLTVEQLKSALISLQNDSSTKVKNGFLMLKAHYRSEGHKISARRLAEAAGYQSFSTGNEQYGSFAHQICNILNYQPELRENGEEAWTTAICIGDNEKDNQGHFQWILRPETIQALEELGLVEKANFSDVFTDIENAKKIIDTLPDKNREVFIKARIGQGKFREQLIKYWEACSVTGCRELNILIASHIKPWRDCTTYFEATVMTNGLLLTPNLDALFDKGFITFENDGSILLSPQLSDSVANELGVKKEMKLRRILKQHHPYLEYHRSNIFRNIS